VWGGEEGGSVDGGAALPGAGRPVPHPEPAGAWAAGPPSSGGPAPPPSVASGAFSHGGIVFALSPDPAPPLPAGTAAHGTDGAAVDAGPGATGDEAGDRDGAPPSPASPGQGLTAAALATPSPDAAQGPEAEGTAPDAGTEAFGSDDGAASGLSGLSEQRPSVFDRLLAAQREAVRAPAAGGGPIQYGGDGSGSERSFL